MEVAATPRYARVSPRKVRLLLEHLPGQSIEDALNMLKFVPTPSARLLEKVVKSAAANAENNYDMVPGDLYIKSALAGDARRLKRFRPRARGRVSPILRRTSHITVVVGEKEA
jgi:large subunit ribosomal protein L22